MLAVFTELNHLPRLFPPQNYAESLCRSFCDLLKDITNEGRVQVLKVLPFLPSHKKSSHVDVVFPKSQLIVSRSLLLSGFIFHCF